MSRGARALATSGFSSIKDLSDMMDMSYEHTRRLVNGDNLPSKIALKTLVSLLKLDKEEAEKVWLADNLRKKYGGIPAELAGRPAVAWAKLNKKRANQ